MIITIEKGCLVCGGDLRGSRQAKYYCKHCNMLFSHDSLVRAGRFKLKRVSEPVKKAEAKLIASSEADKFHKLDCRFAKLISKKNRVYFKDEKEAKNKGFKPCKKCYKT